MENGNKLFLTRHLDEIDDLRKYGRDAPLEKSESNIEKLNGIAENIYQHLLFSGKSAILFITSPRVRAIETAKLVADNIRQRNPLIKMRFSTNENLKATEQGDFVLPEDYSPNDFFAGLDLASKFFTKEAHLSDHEGNVDNIAYRFGDPLQQADGAYKYPELVNYFTKSGESYGETLIRIYESIVEMSEKYQSLLGSTEVVIVAHGQIYHVLRGLLEINRMIKSGEIEFKSGDSVKLLWQVYNNCDKSEKVTGVCMPLDFEALNDSHSMSLLRGEINVLKDSASIQ